MNHFLNASWLSGLVVNMVAWLHAANINMMVSIVLGLLGIVAAYLKIKLMMFEIKQKKQSNEKGNNNANNTPNRSRGISNKV